MKKTLKNVELVNLFNAIKQISETEKYNKYFTYASILTEDSIQSNVMAVLKFGEPLEGYKKYEAARNILIQKYADVDDDGNIIYNDVNHTIKLKSGSTNDAKVEFQSLDEKYVDVLDGREKDMVEYRKMLEKEIDVDIETVDLSCIPDNINKTLMRALKPMIE